MSERITIVVGTRELLDSFQARPDIAAVPVKVFARDNIKAAFEAILTHPPTYLVLDQAFSRSARGTALVERIKGDPAFQRTELLIVQGAEEEPPAAPAPKTTSLLDRKPHWQGTRKAPRTAIGQGVDVQVDGTSVMLIDLSAFGAQVISTTPLKPSQRVRFSLPGETSSRMVGIIRWVAFELPKDRPAPLYRAGLEFADPDATAIEQFCVVHSSEESPA